MNKTLLSVTFLFITLSNLSSQNIDSITIPDNNFILLKNGRLLNESDFYFKGDFFSVKMYRNDGTRIKYKDIKYMRSDEKYIGITEKNELGLRISSGPINIFKVTKTGNYNSERGYYGKSISYYYSFGLEDLKRLEKRKLISELKFIDNDIYRLGNLEIMKLVERGDELKKKKKKLLVTGLSFMAAGFITGGIAGNKSSTGQNIAFISVLGGLTTAVISSNKKPDKLYYDAILLYNHVY